MTNIDAVTTSGALVGAVLAQLRASKGMTQAELAEAIGLSASTWSRIEKGESGLSLDQLRQVAKVFAVTPGVILDMVDAAEREATSKGLRIAAAAGSAASIATTAAIGAVLLPVFGAPLLTIIGGAIGLIYNSAQVASAKVKETEFSSNDLTESDPS